MALPWIKVYADLPEHPKTLDLCDFLAEPLAWAYVVKLWAWCSRFAQDGRLPRSRVEHAAGWTGERGAFLEAAIRAGFLDENADDPFHVLVHQWDVEQKAHLEKLERDRRRQAQRRSGDGTERVARQSRDNRATVANESREVLGEKEREREKEIQHPQTPSSPAAPAGPSVAPPRSVVQQASATGSPPAGDQPQDRENETQYHATGQNTPGSDPAGDHSPDGGRRGASRPEPKPKRSKAECAPSAQDQAVYALWREIWAPRAMPQVDPERARIIAKRRAERVACGASPEQAQQDLLDALRGWQHDPWPERRKNARLDQLLGNAGDVDKGLTLLAVGPPRTAPKLNGVTPYTQEDDAKHVAIAAKAGPGGELEF